MVIYPLSCEFFSRIFELFYVRVCLWKSKWPVMGQIADGFPHEKCVTKI